MPWNVVKRRIGRAGGEKERNARQRQWDRQYGEDSWAIGYVVDGEFILQEQAIDSIYHQSYREHFENHPDDLQELVALAKELRNPHAVATTGVDLQVPAVMEYLDSQAITLQGTEVVDIGTWQGQYSHPISVRLSPLQIKCCLNPRWTLEKYWQNKKCLAVWED